MKDTLYRVDNLDQKYGNKKVEFYNNNRGKTSFFKIIPTLVDIPYCDSLNWVTKDDTLLWNEYKMDFNQKVTIQVVDDNTLIFTKH